MAWYLVMHRDTFTFTLPPSSVQIKNVWDYTSITQTSSRRGASTRHVSSWRGALFSTEQLYLYLWKINLPSIIVCRFWFPYVLHFKTEKQCPISLEYLPFNTFCHPLHHSILSQYHALYYIIHLSRAIWYQTCELQTAYNKFQDCIRSLALRLDDITSCVHLTPKDGSTQNLAFTYF